MLDFVPRVIFWSHVTLKVFKMSEAGTDDEGDTLELAYSYKVNGKYPPGCDVNKKRSIRRKAEKIVLKNGEAWTKRKVNGTSKVSVACYYCTCFTKKIRMRKCLTTQFLGYASNLMLVA